MGESPRVPSRRSSTGHYDTKNSATVATRAPFQRESPESSMILIIDNYDSFTYNLVQRLGELDASLDMRVYRNDQITLEEIARLSPRRMIVSPGPCTPAEAGISVAAIRRFAGHFPILGVCLGHQSIGEAFGARIVRARRLMHGKTDLIYHTGQGWFGDLPSPFVATRYHSLVIDPDSLPPELELTAWSEGPQGLQEIMGVRHREFPLEGWQFHPESFLTDVGHRLLARFLETEPSSIGS